MKFQHRDKWVDLSEYEFLGWQNGWKHVYFDEGGKVTTGTKGERPKYSFGYLEKDYPRYGKCRAAKHQKGYKQMTPSGSTNVEWCDECKIYWKYDCSG